MTRFRPCIDLHSGQVKQIVGGTLSVQVSDLKTNYVSQLPAVYYAQLYKEHTLTGAHVIMLGPGNEDAAEEALKAWPGALQVGGGINEKNAKQWIAHVTYAGGGTTVEDLERVKQLSGGRVDLTIGSALDIFGGRGVNFESCVDWNRKQQR
ncbi:hypothetical protein P7C71_g829, partial [Lecanoromycetidae sp. Uapishka_2]